MLEEIAKYIAKHISLTTEEADIFTSLLTYKKLQSKEFLLQEGQVVIQQNRINAFLALSAGFKNFKKTYPGLEARIA